jgi:hypothetical protein
MNVAFPYLLLPHVWSSRNRARRREKGDLTRALLFGSIGAGVFLALFYGAAWLTWQLQSYEELGDYLLRLGLSWLFMTFLAFLTFSGVVTALSTFFLADDLRLLMTAPVAARRLFYARFARTVAQSSWMVVVFITPILLGVGLAECAPARFYLMSVLTIVPFAIIPVAAGTACTLLLVNLFPARRARDLLMLMGFVFAAAIVILLRMIRPEQLVRAESLPDLTGFFSTLQSPVTPLLPSFWAGELLFASVKGGWDFVHGAALWTTAAGSAKGALCETRRPRHHRGSTATHAGSPAAAAQGREDLSARRQSMVAAAPARRVDADLPLQLPRARSGPHPVHEPVREKRVRVRESGDGRVRSRDRGRQVRVSNGLR